jgi:hypothetical protein
MQDPEVSWEAVVNWAAVALANFQDMAMGHHNRHHHHHGDGPSPSLMAVSCNEGKCRYMQESI